MAIVLILHPLLRKMYNKVFSIEVLRPAQAQKTGEANGSIYSRSTLDAVDAESEQRLTFDFYFALLFIFALHGVSALKIVGILYTNFCIATKLPKERVPVATWVFNIAILFANELCHGYTFKSMAETFLFHSPQAISTGEQIDRFGGIIPRWEILYKITILRQISFNFDYLWSLDQRTSSPIEVNIRRPSL